MAQLKDLIVAGASRLIGNLYSSEAHFNGDVLPEEDNTYSLGSNTLHWKKLFGNAESASQLIHQPNNSTTFLRGDNQFTNILDGQLILTSGADVALGTAGSGVLIIGGKTSQNLTLDNNEIMARNNTTASTLYLNNEGGNIETGSGVLKVKGTFNYSGIQTSGTGNSDHYIWLGNSSSSNIGIPVYDTKLKYNPSTGVLYANNIQLTGTIPLENIPKAALERLYVVDNETKRFQLTFAQVQNGDVIQQADTGIMYYVVDDTKLDSNDGYRVFKAGEAASVEWSNVKNKPNASTLINLGSETATSVFATNPRPGITGTLPVTHGGTGSTSFTQDAVIVGNGGSALTARDILKVTASAINATQKINFSKAGEIGIEINNSQTTNPHKAAFIVGNSGNFGLYDRTKDKWIVYGDPNGNGHLNGEASKAIQLSTARKLTIELDSEVTPTFNGTSDITLGVTNTLPVTHGGTGATAFTANCVLVGNGGGAISARSSLQVTNDNISINKPITTDLIFSNSGTATRQLRMQVGNNDYGRIAAGATDTNAGWLEIATADDGNEPIYVRQYNNGVFGTIVRAATLLDASGNTSFPGSVTAASFSGTEVTIQGATSASNAYNSTNPKLIFMNSAGDQNGQLIWTDYNSVVSTASLTLVGNQGGEHFIAPKINVGGYINNGYAFSASSAIINDWIRTVGNTGWYNQSYGGGWYMTDSTWIRAYNSKPVYVSNRIQTPIMTINTDKTSHNLYVNGTSCLNGLLTIHKDTTTANINTDNGAAMLRFEVKATEQQSDDETGYSIIAAYQTPTATTYNQNLSIYSTGSLYLGAGESADAILKSTNTGTGTEDLFLCANGSIRFYPGADGKTHYYTLNTTSFYPIVGNARTLGTSSNRWKSLYVGTANSYGNISSPIYWDNGTPATINGIHQPLIYNTIDVSGQNVDTWYPVTISGLPGRGYAHLKIAVHLNSGTKPSWSTHSNGFMAIVDMLVTPGGWGTTSAYSLCLENDQLWINDSTKPPVGYSQLTNSSNAVFWLRGGGKYFLYTDFTPTITIRTESTTISSQTIAPTTTYPGISYNKATIRTNIDGNATALTSSAGSTTEPIYFSNGKPVKVTYSLNSTVSAGTTSRLAYYSGNNVISKVNNINYINAVNSTASTPSPQNGLRIWGSTIGNDASNMISNTKGLFTYGDGGPQIQFSTGASTAQDGALIYTDHDSAGAGASWHFVSNQGDWNVTSKRFHARTSISIGTNLPNTSYNLYVNGTSYHNGVDTHAGNLNPSANNTYSLGVSGTRWSKLFIGTVDSYGNMGQPIFWNNGIPAAIDWHIGNSGTGEHNANNINYNMIGYYTSNGPNKELGATVDDGGIYAQAYSSNWVGQIAQDYRNGQLFTRGKNNGSWQPWNRVKTSYTKTITVTGDANTWYPVVITATTDKRHPHYISIWKNLGSTTNADYPGNHSNKTSSMWLIYEYRSCLWDGNGGYYKTWYYSMPYAALVAKSQVLGSGVGHLCVWLRGGTTSYNVSTDYDFTPTPYYQSTNIGSDSYPVTVVPVTSVTSNGWILNSTLGYGNIQGNATTADTLKVSRSLWGNAFNGNSDISGSISMGSGKSIKFVSTAGDTTTSTPTALTYGRLQAHGTLCINANTDNSGTKYVILTAGKGMSSSANDGLAVGQSSLTFQGYDVVRANGGTWNINAATASKLTNLTTTDQASSSDTKRYVWFSYNDLVTGRPAYSSNFTYKTSTNTLFVPQLCITNSSPGIYYQGTKNTYRMLRFIDNTADTYGNGISIGGGGATIIGGGESADAMANQLSTGGSEIMYIGNDGNIDFYSNLQNGWSSGKHFEMSSTGDFSVPEIIHAASLDIPNNGYILTPKGGRYTSGTTSEVTGAIQIALPGGAGPCTMVEFDVIIWTYSPLKRLTYHISGYLQSNNSWNNCNAYAYGFSASYPLPKVRFCINSSNYGFITIGETNTKWSYLRVVIEHINFHYGSKTYNDWNKNWAISIVTTLPTVQVIIDYPHQLSILAAEAISLRNARSIKTNLASTSGANFDGMADITPGITGTLAVSHGGTGQTTLTSGAILIGNGTSAITTRGIRNNTSVTHLGWTSNSADTVIPTVNTLKYWNGRYNDSTSNLAYCNKGAFGDLVTLSTNGSTTKFLRGDGTWAAVSATLTAKGSSTQPIYINSSGQPTNTSYSLSASVNGGTANKLAYYSSNNAISSYSSTTGSATKLWYLDAGVPTNSSSTVGGSNQPVYLNAGVVTACNAYPTSLKNPSSLTLQTNGDTQWTYDGSAAKTLNIKPGTNITISGDTSGNITINASSSATLSAAGSATKPIYINSSGQPAAISCTINTGTQYRPVYYSASSTLSSASSIYMTGSKLGVNTTSITTPKLIYNMANTQTTTDPVFQVSGISYFTNTSIYKPNIRAIEFRPDQSEYSSYIYYCTAGNEALNFVNRYNNTSFIFWTNNSVNDSKQWYLNESGANRTDNPALQIKQNCVYINKLLSNNINPSYTLYVNGSTGIQGTLTAAKVYGAVWNDYAEYRKTPYKVEPGRVVKEVGNGELILATKRLERGCEVVSDTFGFAIGETNECKTPIASTGRVLAYPYEDRNSYEIGAPVCSGPDGTVSQMTEEEERMYPSRIIGTVSEIPTYEEWGSGHVKINGRIWIRIR